MPKRAFVTLGERLEIRKWWRALPWRERHAMRPCEGRAPRGVTARFVEDSGTDDEGLDFYEYLVNHDIVLDDGRRFHICSAHPQARQVLASGLLPAGFRCPIGRDECPMRAILAVSPGRHVRLALAPAICPHG
jgi:hypothetical protein